jgi:transcriptional regulator with XRE-family HTH domain
MQTTREELGMSQMKFHLKTGLDRNFISDLERGVQCPILRDL